MTDLMKRVIERLQALPDDRQDQMAEFVLHELADDDRWLASTRQHAEKLAGLVDAVCAADDRGECEILDPEHL